MSLMIIDDNIFTVRARSADLELALYAANAVHVVDQNSNESNTVSQNNNINTDKINNNLSKDEKRTNDLTMLKQNEDKNVYLLDEVDPVDYDDFHTVIEDA